MYNPTMRLAVSMILIGWAGILALIIVLSRAVFGRFLSKYPLFYTYIGYVALSSVVALVYSAYEPELYSQYYWTSQFVSLLLGLALMVELYRLVFGPYSGVRRVANLLLVVLLILAATYAVADGIPLHAAGVIRLERDLRAVQAVLLLVVLLLSSYYRLPVGKNVRGIATGYGFFIGTSVFNLALSSYFGAAFQRAWQLLQPLEYCVTAAIWCVLLWHFDPPHPAPPRPDEIYSDTSERTSLAFQRLSRQLMHRDAL